MLVDLGLAPSPVAQIIPVIPKPSSEVLRDAAAVPSPSVDAPWLAVSRDPHLLPLTSSTFDKPHVQQGRDITPLLMTS